MKKEVITVPNGKCAMDVLAKMGEQTRNAWIFMSRTVVDKLRSTADSVEESSLTLIKWEATEEYPSTEILLLPQTTYWMRVYKINASDIAFETECLDPSELYFMKMEEE